MKHTTIIDPRCEEEVIIYARERTREIRELESYLERMSAELVGYGEEGKILPLRYAEIHCFTVEDGRVYALTDRERLTVLKEEEICCFDCAFFCQSVLIFFCRFLLFICTSIRICSHKVDRDI